MLDEGTHTIQIFVLSMFFALTCSTLQLNVSRFSAPEIETSGRSRADHEYNSDDGRDGEGRPARS